MQSKDDLRLPRLHATRALAAVMASLRRCTTLGVATRHLMLVTRFSPARRFPKSWNRTEYEKGPLTSAQLMLLDQAWLRKE